MNPSPENSGEGKAKKLMKETILIARDRKTGKDVLLAGREVPFVKQYERYRNLATQVNEEFSGAVLLYPTHCKKPLKFVTKSELDARNQSNAKIEAEQTAEVEAATKTKSEKKGKMKTALTVIALALSLKFAGAQQIPLTNGLPATLATTVTYLAFTNSPQIVAEVDAQGNVAFIYSFNQGGNSTSNSVYKWAPGLDKSGPWDTNNMVNHTIPAADTRRIDWITNVTANGVRFYKLYSVGNPTALTTMTNTFIGYGIKKNAP